MEPPENPGRLGIDQMDDQLRIVHQMIDETTAVTFDDDRHGFRNPVESLLPLLLLKVG